MLGSCHNCKYSTVHAVESSTQIREGRRQKHSASLRASLLTEHLFSLGKVFDFTQHAAKRQTVADYTSQDSIDCSSVMLDHQCGSSGFAQETINISLSCGADTTALSVATTCASNENGEYCEQLY